MLLKNFYILFILSFFFFLQQVHLAYGTGENEIYFSQELGLDSTGMNQVIIPSEKLKYPVNGTLITKSFIVLAKSVSTDSTPGLISLVYNDTVITTYKIGKELKAFQFNFRAGIYSEDSLYFTLTGKIHLTYLLGVFTNNHQRNHFDYIPEFHFFHMNDDNTITIEGPLLKHHQSSENFQISASSNLLGICRSFHFDKSIPHSFFTKKRHEGLDNITLNDQGHFYYFDDNENIYNTITCFHSKTKRSKSTNAKGIKQKKNKTTITYPYFSFRGMNYKISASSSLDGVCKLYGLRKSNDYEFEFTKNNQEYTMLINHEGLHETLYNDTNQEDLGPLYLKKITCEK